LATNCTEHFLGGGFEIFGNPNSGRDKLQCRADDLPTLDQWQVCEVMAVIDQQIEFSDEASSWAYKCFLQYRRDDVHSFDHTLHGHD